VGSSGLYSSAAPTDAVEVVGFVVDVSSIATTEDDAFIEEVERYNASHPV
jgi:hypothetical protein